MHQHLGRAFVIRTCLGIAKVPYEDERLTHEEFAAKRGGAGPSKDFPLGQVPVLTLPSGVVVTQSVALSRYAGKLAKLYPDDAEKAVVVDEIIDTITDLGVALPWGATDPEQLQKLREEFASGKLNMYYTFLASGGPFFGGSEYTIADLHVYSVVKLLRSGYIDHISTNYDAKWPVFEKFIVALESDTVFAPYKL